ncbi:hypothetical protein M231_04830 [Tremella mesenterica]|uniref:Uncharacterized protein n=1 Tax=Tremella mesenterica TaxID=5217 RepID=A0A4Q1BJS0_TREME|nr:hypothetical protein M231_04830 [Tremella mesenterica]
MDGYQLRAEIDPPHQSDVKAVLSINPTTLVTASRDQTVGVWSIQPDGQVRLASILRGHDAYVNSLAHIPPNANHEEDLIASGGNSSLILLHSLKTLDPEPVEHLAGHGLNVCALAYSSKLEKLISGSWDTTARVWSRSSGRWDTEVVLTGHEAAVWGVAILDEGSRTGCYLTVDIKADLMINLWNDKGEILSRFKGSPEPVRSIAICPGGETFISSCNDGLIRSWDLTGSITSVYKGHECYVYQVLYAGKEVVSCGEDHTARVWEEGVLKATISHPCQTVWSVGVLPDGDVVTGGSDGRIRIWTKEESRFAPEDIREVSLTLLLIVVALIGVGV